MIIVQGVGANGLGWNPLVEIMNDCFTCMTFDNRGIGASQPNAGEITVTQMASDLLALMEHIGWTSAHVVGHSLGGMIAMEAALTSRSRVRSLALLCTFAHGRHIRRMTPHLLWSALRLKFGTRYMRRNAFMDLVLPASEAKGHPAAAADRLSSILGRDLADVPDVTSRQLVAMSASDLTGRLPELSGLPTLVVSGGEDILAPPAMGRAIANRIAGSSYVEIPGATHAFPILEPERCSAMLVRHLEAAERGVAAS